MTNKERLSEINQKKYIDRIKNVYYSFLILSLILAVGGILFSINIGDNTNEQTTKLKESVTIVSFDEKLLCVFEEKIHDIKQGEQPSTENNSFFSFVSNVVALLGLSNIIVSSLIVNKAKYKYGYIIYDLLKSNYRFSELNILYYFVILCCDLYSIEYKKFIATICFSLALLSKFISFVIIYYICNISKNAIHILIMLDLDKKIDLAIKSNKISCYKEVSDICHKIIKFVMNQKENTTTNDWLFACECLLKIAHIMPNDDSNEKEGRTLEKFFDTKTRYDYRTMDSAIIFYKAFSSLYSNFTLQPRVLNVDVLNCIHDFFEHIYSDTDIQNKQKHTILIAIALWLFLDVEDQIALNMLNDLVRSNDHDQKNIKYKDVIIIYLCYLYAHMFFYSSNVIYYDNSRFEYVYGRVNSNISVINQLLSVVRKDRKSYSELLLLFKIRLVSCSTLDDGYIYSSLFPTLHTKVFLNISRVKEDSESYDLIDEIQSYFHIKYKERL